MKRISWRPRRGIALISVLWVLTLMAVIAANFTSITRTQMNLTRNMIDNSHAEALADAGVNLAVLGLSDPDPEAKWVPDGRLYKGRYGDGLLTVSVIDETGKIDLNRGQDELLQGLFESAGLEEKAAAALVDAVVDFRDPDDLTRINGAEDDDYSAAGLPYGAKDAPFEAVSELRQVLGMTQALYDRIAPALTVWSRRPGVNPDFAPREVLMAIPGLDGGQVDDYLGQRTPPATLDEAADGSDETTDAALTSETTAITGTSQATSAVLPAAEGSQQLISGGRSRGVYSIRAEGRIGPKTVFVREAVVRVTRDPNLPYQALNWTQGRVAAQVTGIAVDE